MPKVGSTNYAYTSKGRAAAKSQAKKTGQKVTNTKKAKRR
jgi:hypothetical protein